MRGIRESVSALVGQVVDVLSNDAPEDVVVLVYDRAPCAVVAPWQRLVERLGAAFHEADVPVLDALYVCGGRFRSYRCTDPDCCPPQGRVVDATSSAVAAEFVARGSSPLASRAALLALVQAGDAEACAGVEAAAGAVLTAAGGCWGDEADPEWRAWQLQSLRLVQQVAGRYLAGEPGMEPDEAGRRAGGALRRPGP